MTDDPCDFLYHLIVPILWAFTMIMVMSSCKPSQPLNEPAEHHHKLSLTSDASDNPFLMAKPLRKNIHTPIWFRLPSSFSAVKQTAILSAVETWEIVTGKDLFARVSERLSDKTPVSQPEADWHPRKSYEELISGVSEQDCDVLVRAAYDGVTDFFFIKEWDVLFARCKDFEGIAQAGAFTVPIYSRASQPAVTYISGDIYFNTQRFCFRDIKADDCDQHPMEAAIGYMLAFNQSLERIVLHELGHLLGLDHVAPLQDLGSIMQPSAGFHLPGVDELLEMDALLSKGDITRIQSLYGCHGKVCDIHKAYVMQKKSQRPNSPPSQF